jgi:LysM repeat protein
MAVVVVRDSNVTAVYVPYSGARMQITSESGKTVLSLPFAPREIDYGNFESDWAVAERPADTPLLLLKQRRLKTMAFSFLLTDPIVIHASQRTPLEALQTLCDTSERILVRYGPQEAGLWRITEAGATSQMRDPVTNEVTRARVSITLTRASDAAVAIGPISGGAKPPTAPAPAPAPRRYTVVAGDCLWKIAARFYNNGVLWPRIFDANRNQIRNPNLIYPGQVFIIP